MRKTAPVLLALGCALSLFACSARKDASEPVLSGTLEESLVEATATVEAVDPAERTVTIRRENGKRLTLPVGEQVKNLSRVEVGDEVRVVYYESIAFDVRPPGGDAKPEGTVAEAIRTPVGAQPGASDARMLTVTATLAEINRAMPSVTLRGPEGATRTIKVRDPKKLDKVKVGDLVEIHYTRALAVSVQTPDPGGGD